VLGVKIGMVYRRRRINIIFVGEGGGNMVFRPMYSHLNDSAGTLAVEHTEKPVTLLPCIHRCLLSSRTFATEQVAASLNLEYHTVINYHTKTIHCKPPVLTLTLI
jgi:hypothetical protein